MDEENGNYEGYHQQSKKANTPGLQVSNEMNPICHEDTQATNQASCMKKKVTEISHLICIEEEVTFKKNDSKLQHVLLL